MKKAPLLSLGFAVVVAIVLAVASAYYQRPSGEVVRFATECGTPAGCFGNRLAGGFPFAYVFDSPGTSVLNQLGAEDELRTLPFVMDIWVYWILVSLSGVALSRRSEA